MDIPKKKLAGSCSVPFCNTTNKSQDISLHSFPLKNIPLLKLWMHAIRRDKWEPNKYSRICSLHFETKDFEAGGSIRRLRSNVCPSKFDCFPSHLKKTCKQRSTRNSNSIANNKENLCPNKIHSLETPNKPRPIDENIRHINPSPIKNEHNYATSPNSMKRKISTLENKLELSNKKLKLTNKSNQRKEVQNRCLKTSLKELKDKMISEEDYLLFKALYDKLSVMGKAILTNEAVNIKSNTANRYSEDIKKFSVTMNFYSPRAYEYLRSIFCLPSSKTIYNWISNINVMPGILQQPLLALEKLARSSPSHKYCSLILDAMAIKKHITWSEKHEQYLGYVDMGHGDLGESSNSEAKEVLVFLVVGLFAKYRIPIGYFFTAGTITGATLAQLVKCCICSLYHKGIEVTVLVSDGCSSNKSMAKDLGVSLNVDTGINCLFKHPISNKSICFALDGCHMLKLLRNLLCEKDLANPVAWEHIANLEKMQRTEGLHAANKLSSRHIHFQQNKMKVRLAAQVFSRSVSCSLQLANALKVTGFEKIDSTAKFLQLINNLFDVLNSRHPAAKGWKRPLRQEKKSEWEPLLKEAEETLLSLKDFNGAFIIRTQRNTPIIGFILLIQTVRHLMEKYVGDEACHVARYLLTYKFSQDHIELLFSRLRSMLGYNNNPTVQQFQRALASLLLHNEIDASKSANCTMFEEEKDTATFISGDILVAGLNRLDCEDKDIDDLQIIAIEPYSLRTRNILLSEFSHEIMSYIGGFIVRKLLNSPMCNICKTSLTSDIYNEGDFTKLIQIRDFGGLLYPSNGIKTIIETTERQIRLYTYSNGALKYVNRLICLRVFEVLIFRKLFPSLEEHFVDNDLFSPNHYKTLIYNCASAYTKLRLCHNAKLLNQRHEDKSTRHKNNKTTLFSNF